MTRSATRSATRSEAVQQAVRIKQVTAVLLVLLGASCVVAAVALLAGYAWAIGVVGALALTAGVLLYDPRPPRPVVYPNNRGVR